MSTENASPGSTETSCGPAGSGTGDSSQSSAGTARPSSRARRDAVIRVPTTRSPMCSRGPSWQVSVTGSSSAAGSAPMRAPEASCTQTSAMPAGTGAPPGVRTSRVLSTRTVTRSVWSAGRSTTTEPSSSGVSVATSTRVRWRPVSIVTTLGAAGASERGAHRRSDPTRWRPGRRRPSDGDGASVACQLVERSPSTAADGAPAGSVTRESPSARTCRAREAGSPRRTSSRALPGRGRTSNRGATAVSAGTSSSRANRPGSSGAIARSGAHRAAPVASSAPASPSTGLPPWTQSVRPASSCRSNQPDGARVSSARSGRAMVRSSGMSSPPAASPISETSKYVPRPPSATPVTVTRTCSVGPGGRATVVSSSARG